MKLKLLNIRSMEAEEAGIERRWQAKSLNPLLWHQQLSTM
jgi:hypothetical protein